MADVTKATLGTTDYLMFALMLLISTAIGIYFRFTGGRQRTTDEYLMAGRNMSIIPVAFSLMASFLSAVAVIGTPGEVYNFGMHLPYMNIGGIVGVILSSYVMLPVFFDLQVMTAYEYLEKRFGILTRKLTSIGFIIQMILFMAVALYAPALALSAVTNLPTWTSIVSTGVVCTFYCMMGGMKAVLWTDVFQALLMFLCVLAVLIKGCIDLGGFGNIFRIASEGGRLAMPGFEFDPEIRYTMWNLQAQALIMSISGFGGNQLQIQRLLTVKNVARARMSIIGCIIIAVPFHVMNCSLGLILYAYYYKCDPLSSTEKVISSADQLMPYHIMLTLSQYPGLAGACVCGIFSASLSSLSSAVNCLTAVTMEDFIRPLFLSRGFSQTKIAYSAKAITVLYGLTCLSLTFLVATFGNLIQASLTIFGMIGGPAMAVFLLGMLTERTNEKGVVIGMVLSTAIALWASFGASAHGPPPKMLPMSTEGCLLNSSSLLNTTSSPTDFTFLHLSTINPTYQPTINSSFPLSMTPSHEDIFPLYRISYLWFAPLGFLSGIIIGYVASILITLITGENPEVPEELLSPVFKWFFRRAPTKSLHKKEEVPLKLNLLKTEHPKS